ncbi:hypothetical protein COO60DRAFT_1479870 [Scenedesmus sp. NREL 46B-D3]|nr:hypothetical protein COO60DRAFT_1479870 [Scenedesmus sp. NREL 46B-D3]
MQHTAGKPSNAVCAHQPLGAVTQTHHCHGTPRGTKSTNWKRNQMHTGGCSMLAGEHSWAAELNQAPGLQVMYTTDTVRRARRQLGLQRASNQEQPDRPEWAPRAVQHLHSHALAMRKLPQLQSVKGTIEEKSNCAASKLSGVVNAIGSIIDKCSKAGHRPPTPAQLSNVTSTSCGDSTNGLQREGSADTAFPQSSSCSAYS